MNSKQRTSNKNGSKLSKVHSISKKRKNSTENLEYSKEILLKSLGLNYNETLVQRKGSKRKRSFSNGVLDDEGVGDNTTGTLAKPSNQCILHQCIKYQIMVVKEYVKNKRKAVKPAASKTEQNNNTSYIPLDVIILKHIKNACKHGSDEVSCLFIRSCIKLLNNQEPLIRLLGMYLLNELVVRSSFIRKYVLEEHVKSIIDLTIGSPTKSLPPPIEEAQQLTKESLNILSLWRGYGYDRIYPSLRICFKYLTQRRSDICMPDIKFMEKEKTRWSNHLQHVRELCLAYLPFDQNIRTNSRSLSPNIPSGKEQIKDLIKKMEIILQDVDTCIERVIPNLFSDGNIFDIPSEQTSNDFSIATDSLMIVTDRRIVDETSNLINKKVDEIPPKSKENGTSMKLQMEVPDNIADDEDDIESSEWEEGDSGSELDSIDELDEIFGMEQASQSHNLLSKQKEEKSNIDKEYTDTNSTRDNDVDEFSCYFSNDDGDDDNDDLDILLPTYGIQLSAASLRREEIEETEENSVFLENLRSDYKNLKKKYIPLLSQWLNVMNTILYSGINVNKIVTGISVDLNSEEGNIYFSKREKIECESLYFQCEQLQKRVNITLSKIREEIFGVDANKTKSKSTNLTKETYTLNKAKQSRNELRDGIQNNNESDSTLVTQLLNDTENRNSRFLLNNPLSKTEVGRHKKPKSSSMVIRLKSRNDANC